MHTKLTLDAINVAGKRVLMRVDFNVPLKEGVVTDDTRIQAALPSIKKILAGGASLVLMSHLGRPKGQRVPAMSLAPAAQRLSELLDQPVGLAPDCIGDETLAQAKALAPGQVLLLENLRFHAEETANDADFAAALGAMADVYVNDAFGAAHRAHASTAGVTAHFDQCAAGELMQAELSALGRLLAGAERPYVAILGGAKVSDKIEVIESLMSRVDHILIGGAMAYTFLKTQGHQIGKSLLEADKMDVAQAVFERSRQDGVASIHLPQDHVEAAGIDAVSGKPTTGIEIAADVLGADIGPKTVAAFSEIIQNAKTIFWNGPMGVFENPAFAEGTMAVAHSVSAATSNGAFSVVGGGDSVSALKKSGLADRISHVSTGGGASLDFMSEKTLPGVAALSDTA